MPSDAKIEATLRAVVANLFRENETDSLTLKHVRVEATKQLEFPDEFFKTDVRWKDKSKEIVHDEVAKQEAAQPSSQLANNTDSDAIEPLIKKPLKVNNKRKSPAAAKPPRKRRKAATPSDSEPTPEESSALSEALSDAEESPVKKAPRGNLPKTQQKSSTRNGQNAPSTQTKAPTAKKDARASGPPPTADPEEEVAEVDSPLSEAPVDPEGGAEKSESEMSVVLDEPRPKKPGGKKANHTSESNPTSKAAKTSKASKSTTKDAAQSEELKTLQNQLSKCGVRKLWGKELAQFSSHSQKVAHLKQLLKDVGMTGRFSEQKAKQIKEERELKMDIEDIVERERKWGEADEKTEKRARRSTSNNAKVAEVTDDEDIEHDGAQSEEEDDDSSTTGKPKRRLARGLKELQDVFGDNEEDSD